MSVIHVFLGPTLSAEEARPLLDAVYHPPAARGDVYRACRGRPFAIGLVDGYFDRVPAVWHKEILWALTQGVHVFGAASMGALRAAELATFGMRGVGSVYEAFASGALEDDDEVAVAHADESAGFARCSEAMVNIRATLEHAARRGAISVQTHRLVLGLAKREFYAERSYPRLLQLAAAQGLAPAELDGLAHAFTAERQDAKRADALELLQALRRCRDLAQPPPPVRFRFAHTDAWSEVIE